MKELKDYSDVNKEIQDANLRIFILNMNDQMPEDIGSGDIINFVNYFGGYIYLIENKDDMDQIILPYDFEDPADKTLLDGPAEFDIAEWVCDGMYAQFMLVTNNGGGNIYFIPRVIARENKFVVESIKLTETSHKIAMENMDLKQEKLEEDARDIQQEIIEARVDSDMMADEAAEYDDPMSDELEVDLNDTPHEN